MSGPVLLVCMPFAPARYPSPALGALAAALDQDSIDVKCVYATVEFADRVGWDAYSFVAETACPRLAGEWIFAQAAFPDDEPADKDYLARYFPPSVHPLLQYLRAEAGGFVQDLAKRLAALEPLLVGCTAVFTQCCASLALLRRIKQLYPAAATIMGGGQVEGCMGQELHRQAHWLEYVFSGEADKALPELCRCLRQGRSVGGAGWNTPGLITPADRDAGYAREIGRGLVTDMDALPDAEYADYYAAYAASRRGRTHAPGLLLETARGCRWGERKPCSFCSLNGSAMHYRAVSADRAVRKIRSAVRRFGIKEIEFTDNIMPAEYVHELLPRLTEDGLTLYYEISPTIRREEMRVLSDAGVRWLQPGIENFDDTILAELRKPNRLVHNIRFLKWARELGICLVWMFLNSIPGETEDWYESTAEMLPLLAHLQPPATLGAPIMVDRFSRYFREAKELGIAIHPHGAYRCIYPFDDASLQRFACFWEREDGPRAYTDYSPRQRRLLEAVRAWKTVFASPWPVHLTGGMWQEPPLLGLSVLENGEGEITDTRPAAPASRVFLSRLETAICLLCDAGATAEQIRAGLPADLDPGETGVRKILDDLCGRKLLLPATGRYVSLPLRLPLRPYYPMNRRPGGGVPLTGFDPGSVGVDKVLGL